MTRSEVNGKIWTNTAKSAIIPIGILLLVMFMVVPVPAFMLDIGFIANIMISLAVVMVALNAAKPLDFSAFPTVLLFATLLRLALNVASTRVVLVNGHTGAHPLKHTVNVAPGGQVAFDLTASEPGDWAFHCHLLLHMHAGMFNVVTVRPLA